MFLICIGHLVRSITHRKHGTCHIFALQRHALIWTDNNLKFINRQDSYQICILSRFLDEFTPWAINIIMKFPNVVTAGGFNLHVNREDGADTMTFLDTIEAQVTTTGEGADIQKCQHPRSGHHRTK